MIIPKEILVRNIKEDILDNSVGAVSPQDIRRNLLDIIDSVSLLTEYNDLNSQNFSTADLRTLRAGEETLSKRKSVGYSSVDNVAVGYSALKSQIDAKQNVAVGSFALNCNMYGPDNVAVGFHALGSNINGYGNIGIGSYSLNNNKEGNFNIAIGQGAGYYVNRNESYQFFLASHAVTEDSICENKNGQGLIPLLKGDLSSNNLRLGIGVRTLHEGAALQVAGNIHPSVTNTFSLGSSDFRIKNLYLQSSINYSNNDYIQYSEISRRFTLSNSTTINDSLDVKNNLVVTNNISSPNGHLSVGSYVSATSGIFSDNLLLSGHVFPENTLSKNLGDRRQEWMNGHIYNIYSRGVAKFNVFHAEEQSHFRNKTIYLGSTGDLETLDGGGVSDLYENFDPTDNNQDPNTHSQYLLDEDLIGAGFKIGSSGVDYLRLYELTFRSRNETWNNLSIDDPYSRSSWFSNISLETASGRHVKTDRIINSDSVGMFTYNNDLGFFIESGVSYLSEENGHLDRSGLGDFNIISPIEELDNYTISIQSPKSQVNLFQTFLENTESIHLDLDQKEKITGFKTGYISDSQLPLPNFFNEQAGQRPNRYIISSYNDSSFAKRCFTLLQDQTEGYVGISNFDYSESMLPDTILNVRSTGNAVVRVTAENQNDTEASLELLGGANCKDDGVSLQYIKSSGVFHLNTFRNSVEYNSLTINDSSGHIAILNKYMNSNAMLSLGDDDHTDAVISIRHSSGVPVATENYGQIFTREVQDLDVQSTLLSFMDSSGNLFNVDLTATSFDGSTVDKPLALDTKGNTFGGIRSPLSRNNITASTVNNTAIGYEACSNILDGTNNTCLGYRSGKYIENGFGNVYLGSNLGSENTSQSIVIGTNLSTSSNELAIGHGQEPLINGSFTSKYVNINNTLKIDNALTISKNSVLFTDKISFNSSSLEYLSLESNNAKFSTNVSILGTLSFANGTSISNANFLNDIALNSQSIQQTNNRISTNETSFNQLKNNVDTFIIEGVVEQNIRFDDLPNSFNDTPLQFYIRKKVVDSSNNFVNAPSTPTSPNLVLITLRDPHINVRQGDYVIAIRVNGEYRPIAVTGPP